MTTYESATAADLEAPWWEEKTATKALPKAQRLFQYYADNDKNRLNSYNAWSALYLNRDVTGTDVLRAYTDAFTKYEYSRVPLNVCKVFVDAVHARLTRPAVSIEFLPAGGNFTLRKRARQASQYVAQQNHECSLRRQESCATLDTLLYGLGAIKTCPHPVVEKVENFRVHPRDLFCDPVEASANGTVSHLYQRQFVSRGRLQKLFPRFKMKIAEAQRLTTRVASDWSTTNTTQPGVGMVEVVEGWKLPSWRGAGDGKHIILIDGVALIYEDWEEVDFPFSFTYWKRDPTLGFFGVSLAEELVGIHFDINTSLIHVEKCIEKMPKPYILVPGDGEVNEGQLGNIEGTIINHTGRAPQIVMPPSVPADVVNYVDKQWERGLRVSRLVALGMPESAGGQGQTGAAFDTIVDIQSTELSPAFKEREDFLVRLGEQQMVAGRMLDLRLKAEGKGGYKTVLRKDRNTIEQVDWSLFALDPKEDCYVVQAQPASALATTFGGKLAQVKEMIGLGLIPISRAFKLLDIPDLDSEMRIQNASLDFIERVMEEILDDGIFTPPEPTMDLRLALKVTQKYINLAQAMGVPDSKVVMLDDFLRGVSELIRQEQEATQLQAQGMQPGVAGGPPAQDITGASPGAASLSGNVMG